jgi:Raf kinase inhibitor-like YbhB/YbcL family protein
MTSATGCLIAVEADNGSSSKTAAKKQGEKTLTLVITSTAFAQGRPIPRKYTGEGADVSPPLAWSGVPEAAKELVLICDDPDAPTKEPWVHWVLYKIPAKVKALPEGIPRQPRLKNPSGALQGKNSWPDGDTIGYRGPMPPIGHGVHHYYFRLYALDTELDLEPGLPKNTVLERIHNPNHILAEGLLMGTYER